MLFPIDDLLDDAACYRLLLSVLHPDGLHCPKGHPLEEGQAPHDRHREPVLDYRCRACGKVFNLYTGTPLHAVRFSPARLVMILRGFCQWVTTLHLSQELGVGRRNLLKLRHRVQGMALEPGRAHQFRLSFAELRANGSHGQSPPEAQGECVREALLQSPRSAQGGDV